MLSTKERAKLRSIAQNSPDLVYIGKEGITLNVLKQVEDNLIAHELVKIKIQKNAPLEMFEIAKELEEKCECQVVENIGSKIVVYKYSNKQNFKHLL